MHTLAYIAIVVGILLAGVDNPMLVGFDPEHPSSIHAGRGWDVLANIVGYFLALGGILFLVFRHQRVR